MIPDIGLFFPILGYAEWHSIPGILTHCVPAGIAIFVLFETILRRPLVELMPSELRRRIDSESKLAGSAGLSRQILFYSAIAIAIAIAVGAFTHQTWDAFTHQGRWGTDLIPVLNKSAELGGYTVPGSKLLQYGSTIVGLPILIAFIATVLRNTAPGERPQEEGATTRKRWAAIIVCSIPVLVALFAVLTEATYYRAISLTIRLSGAVTAVVALAYCCRFQLVDHRERNDAQAKH